jgi:carbamate kinase
MSRVVVALGGNALIRRGEPGSTEVQRHNLIEAADALADLASRGHQLVLTHGNGPQVGFLSIEADAARDIVPPPPLDVLVAESQGQIGYLLAQALLARFAREVCRPPVVVVLSQTVVDPRDPAFTAPSKPVGPMYDRATAEQLAAEHGWTIAPDNSGWRRVVPSPVPLEIVEASSIAALVEAGDLVIASGGGGIPVSRTASGTLVGVEAVVDKDLAAVTLAVAVHADALLLLTDVPSVCTGWGSLWPVALSELTVEAGEAGVRDGTFAGGSMGPKVAAAAAFVRLTGGFAAIGALGDALAVLEGRSGTRLIDLPSAAVVSDPHPRSRPSSASSSRHGPGVASGHVVPQSQTPDRPLPH